MSKIKLKLKQQAEKGFTLIEVLVGILIATTFTLVAMQAVVLAAYFKVKALETSEGTLIIQEDLEQVRADAATFPGTATTCNPANTTEGYANQLKVSDVTDYTSPGQTRKGSSGRSYNIFRTSTASPTEPYNVLQIEYDVQNSEGDVVAELYTEVIPDGAFNCN